MTVITATPATPDTVYPQPATGADAINGTLAACFQGMWLCTHADNPQYVVIGSRATPAKEWLVPLGPLVTRGRGPVGTWAPRYGLGGPPVHPIEFVQGPP